MRGDDEIRGRKRGSEVFERQEPDMAAGVDTPSSKKSCGARPGAAILTNHDELPLRRPRARAFDQQVETFLRTNETRKQYDLTFAPGTPTVAPSVSLIRGRARHELHQGRVVRRKTSRAERRDIPMGVRDYGVRDAERNLEQVPIEPTSAGEGVVRRIDNTAPRGPPPGKRKKRQPPTGRDALNMDDSTARHGAMQVRQGTFGEPGRNQGRPPRAPLAVARPPRACAKLDRSDAHSLVFVSRVENDGVALSTEKLAEATRMLKYTGISRRFEEMNLQQVRLSCSISQKSPLSHRRSD
jgi:hypothetical protein